MSSSCCCTQDLPLQLYAHSEHRNAVECFWIAYEPLRMMAPSACKRFQMHRYTKSRLLTVVVRELRTCGPQSRTADVPETTQRSTWDVSKTRRHEGTRHAAVGSFPHTRHSYTQGVHRHSEVTRMCTHDYKNHHMQIQGHGQAGTYSIQLTLK